jgi:hypothetical protein
VPILLDEFLPGVWQGIDPCNLLFNEIKFNMTSCNCLSAEQLSRSDTVPFMNPFYRLIIFCGIGKATLSLPILFSSLINRVKVLFPIHFNLQTGVMTLNQFNLLDEERQAIEICKGVCVAGRDDGELKVLLFQLGNFYVELFYHPRKKLITHYQAVENADAYLKELQVDLVEL